jgi:HlyD family secretion protein
MIQRMMRLGVLVCLLGSCAAKDTGIHPMEEKITASVYAAGMLKSKNQYQVYATVNGLVSKVLVTEGSTVNKGDPILQLTNTAAEINTDNARITAAYATTAANAERFNELQINIGLAKSKMDNEALLLKRQQNLWEQQIGTRNELEQRELAYQAATKAYETAQLRYTSLQKQINQQQQQSKNNLRLSQTMAGDYTIVSQVAGKVYSILKEKGEMVNALSPVALIGDSAAYILELEVDEYDIAQIKMGQKVMITMDSYKGQVFEALVQKINPLMSEQSRTFTVEAVFVKQPLVLYPNLTCQANIIIQEKAKAITIPRSYLLPGDYVLLANKEKRKVVTGLQDYTKVEILNGLQPTDVIIKPPL